MVGLFALNILGGLVMDGEPRTGRHSFSGAVTGAAILAFTLWNGGFWGAGE